MRVSTLAALLLQICACKTDDLESARAEKAKGRDFEALKHYANAAEKRPKDQLVRAEFHSAAVDFVAVLSKESSPYFVGNLSERGYEKTIDLLVRANLTTEAARVSGLRGHELSAGENWLEALHAFLIAEDQAPTAPEATEYRHEANALMSAHAEDSAALEHVNGVIRTNSTSITYCNARAFILGSNAQFDDAIKEYKRCLALDPNNLDLRVRIGASVAAMQEYRRISLGIPPTKP